jgi:hypothetical protein
MSMAPPAIPIWPIALMRWGRATSPLPVKRSARPCSPSAPTKSSTARKTEPYLEFDHQPDQSIRQIETRREDFVRVLTTRFYIVARRGCMAGGNHFVKKIVTRAADNGRLQVVTDE